MTEQKLNKLEQQIIKLLELANKNINQAEAIAVAAKAQELMAKYTTLNYKTFAKNLQISWLNLQ
jgi:hypothetical protein